MSDLHLSDAQEINEKVPLWKKFKQRQYFVDQDFSDLLMKIRGETDDHIELVLNGDIFDFDSVMALPKKKLFKVSPHEKRRGLNSEEPKSVFKIQKILEDHEIWLNALSDILSHADCKVIFVMGNHDIELHWPGVQQKIMEMLDLPSGIDQSVVFCEWFYLSEKDTLIEHGNQYDSYCLCANPINPLVRRRKKDIVRLPFGNIANKFMVNGMGLKNPHSDESFLMSPLDFARYFFKYEVRIQPFLLHTWFTGAIRTFFVYIKEGWKPALKDPLMIPARIEKIAKKSQTTSKNVRILKEFHAHPAAYHPFMVLRELWLDRAFFLMIVVWFGFQFFSTVNLMWNVSFWWFLIPVFVGFTIFAFYAKDVFSDVRANAKEGEAKVPVVAHALKVSRVIHGHTHKLAHKKIEDVEFLNTGTWSRLFTDAECEKPYGNEPFAWIKPTPDGTKRQAYLYEWKSGQMHLLSEVEFESK